MASLAERARSRQVRCNGGGNAQCPLSSSQKTVLSNNREKKTVRNVIKTMHNSVTNLGQMINEHVTEKIVIDWSKISHSLEELNSKLHKMSEEIAKDEKNMRPKDEKNMAQDWSQVARFRHHLQGKGGALYYRFRFFSSFVQGMLVYDDTSTFISDERSNDRKLAQGNTFDISDKVERMAVLFSGEGSLVASKPVLQKQTLLVSE